MARYVVFLEDTMVDDTTALNLSMDYITNVVSDCKIFVDGLLLTINSDYTITDIVQHPYFTTFKVNFINVVVAGSVVRVEKNEEWNQWIAFKFPDLESRVAALEAQVGNATNIPARLVVLETNLASAEADIVTLNSLTSTLVGRVDSNDSDITALQNIAMNHTERLMDLEVFLGDEGVVAIDNQVVVPIEITDLRTDGYVYSSVKVDYEIVRKTGLEYRSSVGSLYLVCRENGVWMTERGLQVIDLDGVSFSIATGIDRLGMLFYTSDYMDGAGYMGYFKFRTTKFEV